MLPQSTANSTAIINSVLSAMVKSIGQFLDRLQHSNVTLEQITGNNTLLLDYLKLSYKAPIELTKALLHAVINKPEELLTFFMNLAQSENSLQFFCNHSVTNLLAMFQIPADVDLTSVYNTQCDMNLTALGEEAGNMLGIKTVIFNLQQAITDGQFSTLQFNESELVAGYQRLISKLQEIVHDGITFQQPELNHFTVLTLFKELLAKYSNIEDTSAMMKLYGSMVKILLSASQSGHSLDKYFRAVQIILDYFTKLLQQLDVHDGIIQVAALFGDAPEWNKLLTMAFELSSELPDIISKTNVRLNKVRSYVVVGTDDRHVYAQIYAHTHVHIHTHNSNSLSFYPQFTDLFLLNERDFTHLLCNVSLLEEYFIFPMELDLDQLTDTFCQLNTTQLVQEILKVLNSNTLSRAVS